MARFSTTSNCPINEKGICNYNVAGQDVRLSYQVVRDYLVKSGGKVSTQIWFSSSICKFNQLNPFLGVLPCQVRHNARDNVAVVKEALLKRADACENYEGIEAGIIVIRDSGSLNWRVVSLPTTTNWLADGQSLSFRYRRYPTVAKVRLDEYDKKQSVLERKAINTMISKVAKVQALREAFPGAIGRDVHRRRKRHQGCRLWWKSRTKWNRTSANTPTRNTSLLKHHPETSQVVDKRAKQTAITAKRRQQRESGGKRKRPKSGVLIT